MYKKISSPQRKRGILTKKAMYLSGYIAFINYQLLIICITHGVLWRYLPLRVGLLWSLASGAF